MKLIFACIILLFSFHVNAGFLTGVIVGSAITSDSNSANNSAGTLISSDKYDILICEYKDPNSCDYYYFADKVMKDGSIRNVMHYVTIDEHLVKSGYSKIHRKAVYIGSGKKFHVLEVSK